ncbi:serine/threonine protein kinase [Marinicrinis sediminis]|uniref:Serine/threonine protein kinase n=1 Tax=Marinicrinis sediminis TaxID=1652465 RepID=A0ABW5R960_9BACL
MTISSSSDMDRVAWKPGTRIQGKWNGHTYTIGQKLGEGANGTVYLATNPQGKKVAMKVALDAVDLQSEVNAIQSLSQAKDKAKPFFLALYDVDDAQVGQTTWPFYTMPYFSGKPFSQFLREKGWEWFGVVGFQVLQQLHSIHRQGYVFGDLKPHNILVEQDGRCQLIDFGGVTPFGKGVKQFTEWYDRGFWNGGSRIADASYDWFSFAALAVHVFDPEEQMKAWSRELPQQRTEKWLQQRCTELPELKPFQSILKDMLTGNCHSPDKVLSDWEQVLHRHRQRRFSARPSIRWLNTAFLAALLLFVSALWLVFYAA